MEDWHKNDLLWVILLPLHAVSIKSPLEGKKDQVYQIIEYSPTG